MSLEDYRLSKQWRNFFPCNLNFVPKDKGMLICITVSAWGASECIRSNSIQQCQYVKPIAAKLIPR